MEKALKVLSLFDGCGCGKLALEKVGFKNIIYQASEVKKSAIKVSKFNHPDIIQVGDVTKINGYDYDIDLLIGGSPCQGFSSSGKGLNFEDVRSKLFFEFCRILIELRSNNPDVLFMLENVSMKQEWLDVISDNLGVKPIRINSSLVSAQNRVRYYWTNIPGVSQPSDLNINLSDILESTDKENPGAIRGRYINKATILGRRINERGVREDNNKNIPITQCLEVRATNRNKSNCLTTVSKDNVLTDLPIGRHIDAFNLKDHFRYYSPVELCRLQNLPDDYFPEDTAYSTVVDLTGNGWNINTVSHIFSFIK